MSKALWQQIENDFAGIANEMKQVANTREMLNEKALRKLRQELKHITGEVQVISIPPPDATEPKSKAAVEAKAVFQAKAAFEAKGAFEANTVFEEPYQTGKEFVKLEKKVNDLELKVDKMASTMESNFSKLFDLMNVGNQKNARWA